MAYVGDQDGRLRDYLDDKLQTLADLESLDNLLLNVRNQHSLLKQQLDDARKDLQEAKKASVQHATNLKATVKQFEKDQIGIDKRLLVVTQSESGDDAVKIFDATMTKLSRFEIAKSYVQLLQRAESLSDDCLSNLKTSDSAALDRYGTLYRLVQDLGPLQKTAEGAAPHLVDHIRSIVANARQKIEHSFSQKFESVLKKMKWPKAVGDGVPHDLRPEFETAVINLLRLQQPDLEAQGSLNDGSYTIEPLVLVPLKLLVEPLELGFRYHFEGNNIMNRVDRPEFYLSHVTERILTKYAEFMVTEIQPLLLQQFRDTSLGLSYTYIDATSAFITAVLPIVRTKSFSVLSQVTPKPPLFSHFIHELMKFDTELRDEWQYDGGSQSGSWIGLTGEILASDHTFSHWLRGEKEFALSRYQDIVDADDSFDLDFDSLGAGKTKPSKAAIRVNDLLEATTDNYRGLESFSYRLRFLLDIQISIFDLFYNRLDDALTAYLTRTSTIGRASKEDQISLQGIEGLKRLCRIFGSADYLERAMNDWNGDEFFLEMWSELRHRVSTKSSKGDIAGTMTTAQVAARTSSSLYTSSPDGQEIFEEGALFDETAAAYRRIQGKTEKIIDELLLNNIRTSLNAYTRINTWSSLATVNSGQTNQISTTAELDGLLQTLKTLISYLSRALGTGTYHKLVRHMLREIDRILFDNIITSHSFSSVGAGQFSSDLSAISLVVAKLTDRNLVEESTSRILQATALLNIPVRGNRAAQTPDDHADADTEKIGLFEAGKRLFEGRGDDAKELLDELGLDRLGVADARKVLARRVELGS